MPEVLPVRFLFRYAFPVRYDAGIPYEAGPLTPPSNKAGKKSGAPRFRLLRLSSEHLLAGSDSLDDETPFGRITLAWNEGGIGVAAEVTGKNAPPQCDAGQPAEADGLQVWIDTRNTQSIHRASRFCHHFCLLPVGNESDEREKAKGLGPRAQCSRPLALGPQPSPVCIQLPIARAREETPVADAEKIPIAADVTDNGYTVEAWLSADVLNGFDPEANPRVGFYYYLRDNELGEQFLTVGPEFPFAHDPSLWSTLELTR